MARILLVEDDADVRAVIAEALTGQGHRVAVAADYAAALAVLGSDAPELLITNVVLPGGSGRALARAAAASGVPVLYITGNFRLMAELEAEGVHLLRKPFRLHELHAAVARFGLGGAPPSA
jgi:DNA-binding response OmpR family regulator